MPSKPAHNGLAPQAQPPQPPPKQQLLLGWHEPAGPGFSGPLRLLSITGAKEEPVVYDGDAHLITCAPTGAGKGRGVLIPTLLTYPGPIIVMDIKGELFQVTSRRRRQMGQQVVALDPFQVVTEKSDGLNPLDLLTLPRSEIDSDAEMLASLLAVGHASVTDPFWNATANGLIAGLIAQIAGYPPAERHLGQLRSWLYHQDMELAIAKALDNNAIPSRMAREQLIAYITAPHEATRPCIRTMACSYINALGSDQVVRTLRASTFALLDVFEGKPLTIYLIIPPDKLDSHKALLRLWVGTLLTAVTRRTVMPRQRTLFLLDECAQLGELNVLRQAITLLRGAGLQTWTFWQDLSQLRDNYRHDWQTIVNNSAVLQVFGIPNHQMAKEWSELLGVPPQELLGLARQEAVVARQGQDPLTCRRPDYLKDKVFAGLFDPNKRFALQAPGASGV
jgi:type IV secretion system protein VirD4